MLRWLSLETGGPTEQVSDWLRGRSLVSCGNCGKQQLLVCVYTKESSHVLWLQLSLNMLLMRAESFSPTKKMIVQRFIPFPATGKYVTYYGELPFNLDPWNVATFHFDWCLAYPLWNKVTLLSRILRLLPRMVRVAVWTLKVSENQGFIAVWELIPLHSKYVPQHILWIPTIAPRALKIANGGLYRRV